MSIKAKEQNQLNEAIKSLRENSDDVAIVSRKLCSLAKLSAMSSDELLALLSAKPGMKLYKYCSFDKYAKANIANGQVHLSNPNSFDDVFDSLSDADECFYINFRLQKYLMDLDCPFDWQMDNRELIRLLYTRLGQCAATFADFKTYLENKKLDTIAALRLQNIYLNALASRAIKGKSIEAALDDEFQEFVQKHNGYRISCFTTNPTNLKMWSLYANDNKGICIEYAVPEDPQYMVLSVVYSHRRGDMNFLTATNDLYRYDVFIKTLFESVLRKDISWSEQDEYRLIDTKGEHSKDVCSFFPITGIYMGNRMVGRNQSQVKRLCKDLKVKCFYMQRSLFSFELWPIEVAP